MSDAIICLIVAVAITFGMALGGAFVAMKTTDECKSFGMFKIGSEIFDCKARGAK